MPFIIEYSPDAADHLRAMSARQQRVVLDSVDDQLLQQADVETRNRKPMRPNPVAPWELRVGNLRVYYDVAYQPEKRVMIRAIGVKRRNSVWIAGEEVQL